MDVTDLHIVEAGPDHASAIVDVIHAAFGARPQLDPPSTALHETPSSVRARLAEHGGLLVLVDGTPAGALLFEPAGAQLWLRRVGVDPRFQHRGVASALVGCAEEVAAEHGYDTVSLTARVEFPATSEFWERRGYVCTERDGVWLTYRKGLPIELSAPTAEDTRALGERIGRSLHAGDLVLLSGDLGAGKTTLTQGIAEGLGVRGPITSPTFVIARVHPALGDGPPLVHVDAYRLGGAPELDDLDLDADVDEAVTVVEWGEGVAEPLAGDRLDVVLRRRRGARDTGRRQTADTDTVDAGTVDAGTVDAGTVDAGTVDADTRLVKITPVGSRWIGVPLRALLTGTTQEAQRRTG